MGTRPDLVASQAGATVVNRAGAGFLPGSLVDRRQLAPSTALTMYPSLATYSWPRPFPWPPRCLAPFLPSLGALVRKASVWGAFRASVVGTRESGICAAWIWSQPLSVSSFFFFFSSLSLRHSPGTGIRPQGICKAPECVCKKCSCPGERAGSFSRFKGVREQ